MRIRLTLITVFVVTTAVTISTIINGRLYPYVPIIVGIGTLCLLWLNYDVDGSTIWGLGTLTLLSIIYRVFVFIYPYGFAGPDVNRYSFYIAKISNTGQSDVIAINFYRNARSYFILGAETSMVSGLEIRAALIIIPLFIGVVFPIAAFHIGKTLTNGSSRVGLVAAAVTVVAPVSVWLTGNPVPQSVSDPTIIIIILLLSQYLSRPTARIAGAIGVLFFAALFTHKLSPTMLIGGLVLGALLSIWTTQSHRPDRTLSVAVALTVCAYLQWIFTRIDKLFVEKLVASVYGVSPGTRQALFNPSAATQAAPDGALRAFLAFGYWIPLFALAGIGWLYIATNRRDEPYVRLILGFVAIVMVFVLGAFFSVFTVQAPRFLLILIPFLGALVGVTTIRFVNSSIELPIFRVIVVVILLTSLIGTQAISTKGPRDSPYSQRAYLQSDEVAGMWWGYQYSTASIATDRVVAYSVPPEHIDQISQRYEKRPEKYQDATRDLLTGSFTNRSECYYLVRPQVRHYVYQTVWRLGYNPKVAIRGLHHIYSSGGTIVSARPNC